jgi:hypothetical protein
LSIDFRQIIGIKKAPEQGLLYYEES